MSDSTPRDLVFRDSVPLTTFKGWTGPPERQALTVVGSERKSQDLQTFFGMRQKMIRSAAQSGNPVPQLYAGPGDYGQDWVLKRNFYSDSTIPWSKTDWGYSLEGNLLPAGSAGPHPVGDSRNGVWPKSTVWPELSVPDVLESNWYGSRAIRATIPTNPASDAGVAVAELREGLPLLTRRLREGAGLSERLANKYLEYEFGIKPLLSSIREFAQTASRQEELLKQLERDSGRLVRRKFDFPIVQTVERQDKGMSLLNPAPVFNVAAQGNSRVIHRTTKSYWFRGAYTYHFDRSPSSKQRSAVALAKFEELDALYGIKPDASLIWNVMPWSWAADWVGNVGDVLHNISALSQDSLVIAHAYIMCHITKSVTYESDIQNRTVYQQFGTEIKTRKRATPYGFGLNPNGFTARQWAILGALGITQGPRAFR